MKLSERYRQQKPKLIRLLLSGKNKKEIAKTLNISRTTLYADIKRLNTGGQSGKKN